MSQKAPKTDTLTKDSSLSRRDFVWISAILPIGSVLLEGCGGRVDGFSGVKSDIPALAMVDLSLSLALPSSFGADILLLTSGSEVKPTGSTASGRVLGNGPTLLSVLDFTTGKLLGFSIVDPGSTTNVLDTNSIASAMIFLGMGGSNLPENDRRSLWNSILGSPSASTLAGVVASRFAADRFAIVNQDSALVTAIKDAVASFGATRQRVEPSSSDMRSSAQRVNGVPSDPNFGLTISGVSPSQGFLKKTPGKTPGTKKYGSLDLLKPGLTERISFICKTALSSEVSDEILTGPIQIGPAADIGVNAPVVVTVPVGPVNPNSQRESLLEVTLSTVFDNNNESILSSEILKGIHPALQQELAKLFRRSAVGLACHAVMEVLGQGGYRQTRGAVQKVSENLVALGGDFASSVSSADGGKDLAGVLKNIWGAAVKDNSSMRQMLTAMAPLAPTGTANLSEARLNTIREILGAQWRNLYFDLTARFGAVLGAHLSDASRGSAQVTTTLEFEKAKLVFFTNEENPLPPTTYTPGETIKLFMAGFNSSASDHGPDMKLRYTLSGAGDSTIEGKPGNIGKIITQTVQENVGEETQIFTTGTVKFASNSSGVQSVKIELLTLDNESKLVKIDEIKHDFNEKGTSVWGTDGYLAPAGGTSGVAVLRSGDRFMSQWTGVDTTKLRFTWKADENFELGTLDNNGKFVSSGQNLVTTTNSAVLRSLPGTVFEDRAQLTVTVAIVDPATGNFTNLEVIQRTLEVDVINNMAIIVSSSSFPIDNIQGGKNQTFRRGSGGEFGNPLRVSKFTIGVSASFDCFALDSVQEGSTITFNGPNETPTTSGGSFFIVPITGVVDQEFKVFGTLSVQRVQRDSTGKLASFVLVGNLDFRNSRSDTFFGHVQISFGTATSGHWIR